MKLHGWILVLAVATSAAACNNAPASLGCVQGESRACACADGHTGAQVCLADHTFAACSCVTVEDASTLDADALDAGHDGGSDATNDAGPGILIDLTASAGVHTSGGFVTSWDDQSGNGNDAATTSSFGPVLTTASVNGVDRPVLRFGGASYLTAAPHLPRSGTIVIILGNAGMGRVLGWDDSVTGRSGVGMSASYDSSDFIFVREAGAVGDINGGHAITEMECDVASWGPAGVTFERRFANGTTLRFTNTSVRTVSDPGYVLHIGAPGDGPGTWTPMVGDIAALRAYDRQLDAAERAAVIDEMFGPHVDTDAGPPSDAGADAGVSPALCAPYAAMLAGSLGADVAQAVDDCAATSACTTCAAAGGRDVSCGRGGTLQACIVDCISASTASTSAVGAVNAAIAGGSLDLACTGCYAGIPDCVRTMTCGACPGGGCPCDRCQCDRGCVSRFTACAGIAPYLDCAAVVTSC